MGARPSGWETGQIQVLDPRALKEEWGGAESTGGSVMIAVPMQLDRLAGSTRWTSRPSEQLTGRVFCLLVGCGRHAAALQGALRGEGFDPAAVDSLAAARTQLRSRAPDLLVVGEGMQDADPVASLPDLAAEASGSPLLFLADRNDRDLAVQALEHGADDVVVPPHSVAAILLRYHLVGSRLAGRRPLLTAASGRRIQLGSLEVDLAGRRILSGGRPANLSGREFELLQRLLDARGDVVTRQVLLEDIWGAEQGSEAVLDATVHRLRRKLEVDPADPRILTTVRGVGYRLEPVEAPR
jgi:two-component system, OmpR family, response regulator MtrA